MPPPEPPEPPEMWRAGQRFIEMLGPDGQGAVIYPLFDTWEEIDDEWVITDRGKNPRTPYGKPILGQLGTKDEWNGTGWNKLQISLPPDHPAWQQATGVGVNLRTIPTIAIIDDDDRTQMDDYTAAQIDANPGFWYRTTKGAHHWYRNTTGLKAWRKAEPHWGEYGGNTNRNIALPGSVGKQEPEVPWVIDQPFPPIIITGPDADLDPAETRRWGRWEIGTEIPPGEQDDTLASIAGWLLSANPAVFTEEKIADTLWEKVIDPGYVPTKPGKRPYTKADCERIARSISKHRDTDAATRQERERVDFSDHRQRTQGGDSAGSDRSETDSGQETGGGAGFSTDEEAEQPVAAPPDGGLVVEWQNRHGQPLTDDVLPAWWKEIRRVARSRGESFPLTLGVVILRVSSLIPPIFNLPPLPVPAPLNLFGLFVAAPSGGKTASWDIGNALFPPNPEVHSMDADGVPPASGAAIAEAYLEPQEKKEQRKRRQEWSVLFHFDEGARFTELLQRAGNDVTSVLRTAWSGRNLGLMAATHEARRFIEAGTYRICLSIFTQPSVALKSVRDPETGMRHRFIAFPADDTDGLQPLLDDHPLDDKWLQSATWEPPVPDDTQTELGMAIIPVHPDIISEIREYRRAARLQTQLPTITDPALREQVEGLIAATIGSEAYEKIDHGNHTKQMQLRLAAVLAALRQSSDFQVLPEDWDLAWAILRVSRLTLDHYDQHLAAQEDEKERAQARRQGRNAGIANIKQADIKTQHIDHLITDLCAQAEKIHGDRPLDKEPLPLSKLWAATNSKKRTLLNELLNHQRGVGRKMWERELAKRGIYDAL